MEVQTTFFELTATLIPVLLFGGLVAQILRPPDEWRQRHGWAYFAVILVVGWALAAEVTAIRVAGSGLASDFDRAVVISGLVLGIGALAVAIVLPWALKLHRARGGTPRSELIASGFALLLLVIYAGYSITTFVGLGDDLSRAKASNRAYKEVEQAIRYAERVRARARADGKITSVERLEISYAEDQFLPTFERYLAENELRFGEGPATVEEYFDRLAEASPRLFRKLVSRELRKVEARDKEGG